MLELDVSVGKLENENNHGEIMDIKETVEILDFAIDVLNDAAVAREDGLSTLEVVKVAISNAPAAIRAAIGAGEVVAELGDLDDEELKIIADKGVELSKAVMAFFAKAA